VNRKRQFEEPSNILCPVGPLWPVCNLPRLGCNKVKWRNGRWRAKFFKSEEVANRNQINQG